jgi:hypothetical protein
MKEVLILIRDFIINLDYYVFKFYCLIFFLALTVPDSRETFKVHFYF